MEVKLDKRYPVATSAAAAWAVLADVRAVAGCMPGAAITEQIDATHYKGTVKSKVGPAVMSFGGDIEVLALDAGARSMTMLGKGADKSGSSASMNLAAHIEPADSTDGDGACVLVGVATIVVSGKLAQFGSRLLVPVSDAMLSQFADNFRKAAAAVTVGAAPTGEAPAPLADATAAPASTEPPALVAAQTAAGAAPLNAPVATATPASATAATQPATAETAATSQTAARPTASPAGPAVAPTPAPLSRPPAATAPAVAVPAPANELNALGLMWTVFKNWLAGLFGRKG